MDSKKEIEKNNTDTSDIISPFATDDAAVRKFIKTKEDKERKANIILEYPYNAKDNRGNPKSTLDNFVTYLTHSPRWNKVNEDTKLKPIYYDTFFNEIFVDGKVQTDTSMSNVRIDIEQNSGMESAGKDMTWDAVDFISHNNEEDHAIKIFEYLAEKWDGKERMINWLCNAIPGVPDDEYHSAVGYSWLLAMAKRQIVPGTFFKHILTLIGKQTVGKSSLFTFLTEPIDKSATKIVTGDVSDDDTVMPLCTGTLIANFDEGASMTKKGNEEVKAFVSKTEDVLRPKYGRKHKTYQRRWVAAMTENNFDALTDVTGNDRYWIVEVNEMVNFAWLEENREQLLGEAYARAKRGDDFIFPDKKYANELQNRHRNIHPWEERIMNWLLDQESYLADPMEFSVKIDDIWVEALELPVSEYRSIKFHEKRDLFNAMKALNFTGKVKKVNGKSVRVWSPQHGTGEVHQNRVDDYQQHKDVNESLSEITRKSDDF